MDKDTLEEINMTDKDIYEEISDEADRKNDNRKTNITNDSKKHSKSK